MTDDQVIADIELYESISKESAKLIDYLQYKINSRARECEIVIDEHLSKLWAMLVMDAAIEIYNRGIEGAEIVV